ncbi:hypothetical protein C8R47DRAFT_138173 [Mycena vitilis]|nr:hypothetical protein C8R47DRAFT_138173 [Mycena vitilis]
MADEPGDDRRNRFLAESGANSSNNSAGNGSNNGNGPGNGSSTNSTGGTQRAASQPPRTGSSASPRPFLSPTSPTSAHPIPTNHSGGSPWGGLTPSSVSVSMSRSASFSAPRFASTFEDDELVDPDDALYDARYNDSSSPYPSAHSPVLSNSFGSGAGWRGRTGASADLTRSRSQSLATTTATGTAATAIGAGRNSSGYGGIGSAANSYANAYLYGNNAYGHPYASHSTSSTSTSTSLNANSGGMAGSLGGTTGRYAGSPLVRSASISSGGGGGMEDGTNMSPFVRDVGSILLDDGSFRELWERERGMGITGGGGGGGGGGFGGREGGGAREREYGMCFYFACLFSPLFVSPLFCVLLGAFFCLPRRGRLFWRPPFWLCHSRPFSTPFLLWLVCLHPSFSFLFYFLFSGVYPTFLFCSPGGRASGLSRSLLLCFSILFAFLFLFLSLLLSCTFSAPFSVRSATAFAFAFAFARTRSTGAD